MTLKMMLMNECLNFLIYPFNVSVADVLKSGRVERLFSDYVIHRPHLLLTNVIKGMLLHSSNVSNMLCKFNINMSDIINGSASNLMKIAYTGFNALPGEKWTCGIMIILELTDCMHGFRNCGLTYEETKYCLCHIASD